MKKFRVLFILSAIAMASCGFDLPIKELSDAKGAISRAENFDAPRYAPEELQKAKDAITKAHEFVVNEKAKEAKDFALQSLAFANEAYEKTLPLRAKDSIDEAAAKIATAKQAETADAAAEQIALSEKLLGEANSLYSGNTADTQTAKDDIASYDKARMASASAEEALAAEQAALEKINAEKAAKREDLLQRCGAVKSSVDEIKNSGDDALAPDEIAACISETNTAEELTASDSFADAEEKITAAEKLLSDAKAKIETAKADAGKDSAGNKIAAAEKALSDLKEKRSDKKDVEEKASSLIFEAKMNFDEKSYDLAFVKADEALEMIDAALLESETVNVVSDAVAKAEDIQTKDADGFPKEYVVKYNKNDRDCLWKIAGRYYENKADLWPLIYMANRDKIKDPDLIFPGQKLIIPSPSLAKKKPETKAAEESGKDVPAKDSTNPLPASERNPE